MSSYGAIPTSEDNVHTSESDSSQTRHRVGKALESHQTHQLIVGLTIVDILLVVLQIGASLLHLDESKDATWILELFATLSLTIVSIFVVEILLKVYAFGPGYFWKSTPHGLLHLADAIIIWISFLMEVFLTGAEQELGALLIIFRLWRVIKLTGTVAIESTEFQQGVQKELEAKVKTLEAELQEARDEIQRLRANTEEQA